MKWVKRLYIFFLGIILTITTGFGVAAFYPEPLAPTYPAAPYSAIVPQSCYATPQFQATPECQVALEKQKSVEEKDAGARQQYEEEMKVYQNKNASYTRTAIFFGIVIGSLFAVIGLGLIKISNLIATGLLLASVLTAIFTRILISLASLGAQVSGTAGADSIAYVQFAILFVLSIAVIIVGRFSLTDQDTTPASR